MLQWSSRPATKWLTLTDVYIEIVQARYSCSYPPVEQQQQDSQHLRDITSRYVCDMPNFLGLLARWRGPQTSESMENMYQLSLPQEWCGDTSSQFDAKITSRGRSLISLTRMWSRIMYLDRSEKLVSRSEHNCRMYLSLSYILRTLR